MRDKPLLKRIHDLRPADFDAHPIWMNVHGEQDQPWYGETDEVTYRPWVGAIPYDCSDPLHSVLVRADFRLANGAVRRNNTASLAGCLTRCSRSATG